MLPLGRPQRISLISPSNLLYDPRRPILQFIPEVIKTNLLTNFQANLARNVASRVPQYISFI